MCGLEGGRKGKRRVSVGLEVLCSTYDDDLASLISCAAFERGRNADRSRREKTARRCSTLLLRSQTLTLDADMISCANSPPIALFLKEDLIPFIASLALHIWSTPASSSPLTRTSSLAFVGYCSSISFPLPLLRASLAGIAFGLRQVPL